MVCIVWTYVIELSIILIASDDNPDASESFFLKCGRQEDSAACSMDESCLVGLAETEAVCCEEEIKVQKLIVWLSVHTMVDLANQAELLFLLPDPSQLFAIPIPGWRKEGMHRRRMIS